MSFGEVLGFPTVQGIVMPLINKFFEFLLEDSAQVFQCVLSCFLLKLSTASVELYESLCRHKFSELLVLPLYELGQLRRLFGVPSRRVRISFQLDRPPVCR